MKTPSKINKRTNDKEGDEINGGDSYMSESNVVEDLPLAKINADVHLVKSNKSEDGEESKKKIIKKKQNEESKHKEYKEFKSNECEDDNQGKKMKKKRKLIEGNTLNECNDFRSNGEEDGQQEKKMKKKKKQSEESIHKEHNEFKSNECEDDQGKKMKKKKKLTEGNTLNECNDFRSNGCEHDEQHKKMKKKKKKPSEESKHKKKPKRVTFSDGLGEKKKFTPEEDEKIKASVFDYIDSHGLGDEGLDKVLHCRSYPEVRGCWKEITKVLPHRPWVSVYKRAHSLLENMEKKWTADEYEFIWKSYEQHGPNWKPSEESKHKKKSKRVTFSDDLVRGKRFTPEEDEKIKASVFDFIDSHGLGDEGLDKVLHSLSYPEVRGCWKEITKVLPHRPLVSVYRRAHSLLENIERKKWTPDEYEFIRKSYQKHGPNWRLIADTLGRSLSQVKDAWRVIKNDKLKHGFWSQEECQTLFDLVNLDLQARALEPTRKKKHGMLRDNISWEAISQKLGTRDSPHCCKKWYDKLVSPMVASGDWCDTDDYRMMNALYTLDACCMEEVDWDELLEHRSGDVCRKRWEQMVRRLGEHANKSFIEQVEVLTKRYCPKLLEAREAFDNKPVTC